MRYDMTFIAPTVMYPTCPPRQNHHLFLHGHSLLCLQTAQDINATYTVDKSFLLLYYIKASPSRHRHENPQPGYDCECIPQPVWFRCTMFKVGVVISPPLALECDRDISPGVRPSVSMCQPQ
jgi:hypothetical protein